MEGGIDDVGVGVLFGLDKYRYEFAGLLMHAEVYRSCGDIDVDTADSPVSVLDTVNGIKLTQEEIRREVIALQDMGHKRLALEAGEDPVHNTMDYYLDCINTNCAASAR